jgi:hypothetical protein
MSCVSTARVIREQSLTGEEHVRSRRPGLAPLRSAAPDFATAGPQLDGARAARGRPDRDAPANRGRRSPR